MADILSDQEMEAIKDVMMKGKERKAKGIDHPLVSKKLSVKLVNLINVVFSRFLLNFRALASVRLRRPVVPSLKEVESIEFGRFLEGLPRMCWVEIFETKPLEGKSLLVIGPELACALVDVLCGGTGDVVTDRSNSTFAPLEQSILEKFVDFTLSGLEEAWRTIVSVSVKSVGHEFNPSLLAVYPPEEIVVVIPMDLSVGKVTGSIFFVMSRSSLEYFRMEVGEAEGEKEAVSITPGMVTSIMDVESEVSVVLGERDISFDEFLALKEGQVLSLDKPVGDEVEVKVEGIVRFLGQPVKYRGSKAVKITKVVLPVSLKEVLSNGGSEERRN